jgi:alanine racemase
MWDEAVIMGKQGDEEITVRDIAKLKNSVTYDVLTNWRLRREAVNGQTKTLRELETAIAE